MDAPGPLGRVGREHGVASLLLNGLEKGCEIARSTAAVSRGHDRHSRRERRRDEADAVGRLPASPRAATDLAPSKTRGFSDNARVSSSLLLVLWNVRVRFGYDL